MESSKPGFVWVGAGNRYFRIKTNFCAVMISSDVRLKLWISAQLLSGIANWYSMFIRQKEQKFYNT